MAEANRRGIFTVKRRLDEPSNQVIEEIVSAIRPEIVNAARPFYPKSWHVTVIGFSRYSKEYKLNGKPTKLIGESIPTTKDPIEVRLGRLGVFGGGSSKAPKLAINISSDKLDEEVERFELAYDAVGSPLLPEYNSETGSFAGHISLALINSDRIYDLSDPRYLRRLSLIAGLIKGDQKYITLAPVAMDEPTQISR